MYGLLKLLDRLRTPRNARRGAAAAGHRQSGMHQPSPETPPGADMLTGEPVRLVIWDLDETFWDGTLTEGGIRLVEDNASFVKALARRGIISSICSKNDPAVVEDVLREAGIWDYFVFPSINWEAKGPRLRQLIEAVQLRPASVVFIDDNPSNLDEAAHFVPGLRTLDARHIGILFDHALLRGKADHELSRLKQYRQLQQRQGELAASSGDVAAFLRASNIKVSIEHDVAAHLDRAIELINRTNQLNFTKERLSEDPGEARVALAAFLGRHDIQAGLIRVSDRFGDHGFAGFYAFWSSDQRLVHYCFSCRILGMGVEQWLYRKLGCPKLDIVGHVLSDPRADDVDVDWINAGGGSGADIVKDDVLPLQWVSARGGCEITPLLHYFSIVSSRIDLEFNFTRDGCDPRIDHSMFLRYAIEGLSDEALEECRRIGYTPDDFKSGLLQPVDGRGLWLLGLWADSIYALYRHRRLGFCLPWARPFEIDHDRDVRETTVESLPMPQRGTWIAPALETLQNDYDYIGLIGEAEFHRNLDVILSKAPPTVPVFILKRVDYLVDAEGHEQAYDRAKQFNAWLDDVAARWPCVRLVDIRHFATDAAEITDWLHFDRMTYHRIFEGICLEAGLKPHASTHA